MNAGDRGSRLADSREHDDCCDHNGLGPVEPAPVPAPRAFADEVFGGSRFLFWSLGPLSAFVAITLLATIDNPWSVAGASKLLLGACGLLFALALAAPRRFGLAARGVTAIVFLLCLCYLVEEWLADQPGSRPAGGPGASSLPNAIRAFLAFGLPSLWFTVRRRAQ